ncbi:MULTISPECIES: aminotransferase class V-fold PLP-dependent enzyme [Microbacterium]|uniref:aminotransferase class V-fold PLP-dependent enzyme n=1 Tax=Microbacterium TaxID=33882 RepID=UPI00214B15B6|nr:MULTISPECIES: aminotransferase class V-fold PLP-dependent enzyme [unclassified Microbacterium]MCR2813287.1 aminotransferase class V-fold PLP-dependent enzyme [Microbacterium sp. zg.Y1084]MDL5487990.1 aminotransferase class V-fold PLP-dependent enzyme [Microbacterium sp. zg-Y1211]
MPIPPPASLRARLASGRLARDAWPLDPEIVHLNHGSFGAVPREVVAVQDELRRRADASPVGWFPRVAEYTRTARWEVAPFVGARPEDTVFVPNASAAATVVYNSLRLEPSDEILVTDHGYGAITMGAARLARRYGARVRTVRVGMFDGEAEVLEAFRRAFNTHTRLIVIDQVTSPTALRLPTREITALAHEHGIRVLVDGAHAPGLIPDAARQGGGDWWFGNLHKWACAPRGAAVLVTSADDRQDLWPLIDSWGGDEPFPDRFDSQGTIDATSYIAAPAAIEFIEREYGWARARERMWQMADIGAAVIAEALQPYISDDARVDLPRPVPPMRLIRLPDGLGTTREEADELRMLLLDATGVETAFTSYEGRGYFRLSVHLYTEAEDFAAFVERCVPEILRRAGSPRVQSMNLT